MQFVANQYNKIKELIDNGFIVWMAVVDDNKIKGMIERGVPMGDI
jgi:hypothetical protein